MNMEQSATILLITLAAACGLVYFRQARRMQKRRGTSAGWAAAAIGIFAALFFGQSWFLDEIWMPRWFYQLIVKYPDAVGFMLVMVESATITILLQDFFLAERRTVQATTQLHTQIVGRTCAACGARIISHTEGSLCLKCGVAVHSACASATCPSCGEVVA